MSSQSRNIFFCFLKFNKETKKTKKTMNSMLQLTLAYLDVARYLSETSKTSPDFGFSCAKSANNFSALVASRNLNARFCV